MWISSTGGPVTLDRGDRLSFYFCSGYAFHAAAGSLRQTGDHRGRRRLLRTGPG
jgi:hypothetical protein